jgi:hypothetical protein
MYIDTTSPDLQGFDPENQGLSLPPVGVYTDLILQIVESKQGETSSGQGKFDITYQILNGELSGSLFRLTYNTGNSNPDTAKWAIQDVLRVVFAVTGLKEHGRGFEFNEKLNKIPFNATLTITNQSKTDDKGVPYRQGKLTQLKPISNNNNQPVNNAVAQGQYNQAPAQQQQYNNAGQQQNASPSWAR